MPAELTNVSPSCLIAGIVGAIALMLILIYLKLKLSGRGEVLTFLAFCFMCITAMWLITFMYAPAIFWGITGLIALALVSWLCNSLAKIGQSNRALASTERIHNRSLGALEAGADREAVGLIEALVTLETGRGCNEKIGAIESLLQWQKNRQF